MKKNCLLFAVLLTLMAQASLLSAGKAEVLGKMTVNGGEELAIFLTSDDSESFVITKGKALRVPPQLISPDVDTLVPEAEVELDVNNQKFSVKTNAKRLVVSGAKTVRVVGIDAWYWGVDDDPALFLDRDCRAILKGRATATATVEVHPSARVVIDARLLDTPCLVVVGPSSAKVLSGNKTAVFHVPTLPPEVRQSAPSGAAAAPAALPPISIPPRQQPTSPQNTSPPKTSSQSKTGQDAGAQTKP